jgi:hypothetical protein
MYIIYNKLPQPINLDFNGETVILPAYGNITDVSELSSQVKSLIAKNFIKIKEKK